MSTKSKIEKEDESQVRYIARLFEKRGIEVRRENLARGTAFKVRSGNCLVSGQDLIFVDKRLPVAQQLSFLLDTLVECELELDGAELAHLNPASRNLLTQRVHTSAP